MKILAVSDVELDYIYRPQIAERFNTVDLIISCGDLSNYYLEYMVSMLNIPLYYVNGNHTHRVEFTTEGDKKYPWGATNVHQRCIVDDTGVLLAGIEGSLRYNRAEHQYTQAEMWQKVFGLMPRFFYNKLRYGRFLDIFISHAPPWHIHDQDDLPHRGIKAFRWLIKVFEPVYHLHGHIHLYRNDTIYKTLFHRTQVINCYGYREINFDMAPVMAAIKKN